MVPYIKHPLTFQEQVEWFENNKLSRPEDRVAVTYSLPPLWKSVNAMSLGSVSYGIRYTASNAVKKKIALDLGMPNNPKCLESFLIALSTIRNVCAHHSRLWSQPLPVSMMSTKELPIVIEKRNLFTVSNKNTKPKRPNTRDIFSGNK